MAPPAALIPDFLFGVIAILVLARLLQKSFSGERRPLRERLLSFDFLKGICIILVIALHARDVASIPWPMDMMVWLAVPSFIFISGYLTARRHPDGVEIGHFVRVWWRIGAIYTAYTLFWMLLRHVPLANLPRYLLLGLANWGILYFIPILLGLYLAYPLLLRIRQWTGRVPFLIICLCISILFESINLQHNGVIWNVDPVAHAFFGRMLFFFAVGMCVSGLDLGKVRNRVAIAAALIAFLCLLGARPESYFIPYFFAPLLFTFLLFCLYEALKGAARAITGIFEAFGRYTLGMYLVHPIILYVFLKPLFGEHAGADDYFLAIFIVAVSSYAVSLIFMRGYAALLERLGIRATTGK